MQDRVRQPPLNAVRAFVAAARLGSIKGAAADLGVTASAISRHVRQLEEEIGKPLFVRRNNSIELTRDGRRFYEQVGPALKAIARASDTVRKETGAVAVSVSTSLALSWLIPRLPEFRKRYPRISIEIETERRPVVLTETLDVAISFSRHGAPEPDSVHLLSDRAIPMATAALMQETGNAQKIETAPLITSTPDAWEWRKWSADAGVPFADLQVAYRFDTDSAALAACSAGLGIMLVPAWLSRGPGESEPLRPFGTWKPQSFGDYWISVAPRVRPAAKTFVAWLLGIAGESRSDNDNLHAASPALTGKRPRRIADVRR